MAEIIGKMDFGEKNINMDDEMEDFNSQGTPISLEEIEKFYQWLQGKRMKGYYFREQPQLSKDAAFAVIYMLQEGEKQDLVSVYILILAFPAV